MLEAAYLHAKVDQESSLPGFVPPDKVASDQLCVAFESAFGDMQGRLDAGLDLGYASGDKAPRSAPARRSKT